MAEEDHVGQDGHRDPLVIASDDRVGVELPGAAGRQELERPEVLARLGIDLAWEDHALLLVPLYVPDEVAERLDDELLLSRRVVREVLRGNLRDGQTGQVALDTDALDLLDAFLEVPRAKRVAEDRAPLGVRAGLRRPEQQTAIDRDGNLATGPEALDHRLDPAVVVELPPDERLLGPQRELPPAVEPVGVLRVARRIVDVAAANLVDDLQERPAER